MTGNERLAAALRLLPAWVIAAGDRMASRDHTDVLAIMGEDIAAIFPSSDPEDVAEGVATLLYILDVGLARAAHLAGITSAELATDITQRIAILNFGQDG